jgi:hypothetical protein
VSKRAKIGGLYEKSERGDLHADLPVTFRVAINESAPGELNGKSVDTELQALRSVMTKVAKTSLWPGTSMAFRF